MPENLKAHAQWAAVQLQNQPLAISGAMRKHQLKLADRQCRMSELSGRVQRMIIMLATSLFAAQQNDETITAAADVICDDLRRELTGERPATATTAQ